MTNTVEPQDIAPDQEVVDLFADQPQDSEDLSQYDLTGAVTFNEDGTVSPLVLPEQAEEQPAEVVEEEEKPEFVMPKKFQDKGIEEIVEAYNNAQRHMGKLQNELNEYKKLSEGIVKRELDTEPQKVEQTQSAVDVDRLLEDPNAAIGQVLENHPALKQMQEQMIAQQHAAKQAQFVEKYPNALEIAGSQHFQEWVNATPARQRLYAEADANYDLEMAGELMDMYTAIHSIAKADAEAKREDALKTVSGVSAPTGKPASSGTRKKWYKQSQVLQIMQDPAKYQQALEGGLEEAMAEGRIHYHL